MVLPKYLVMNVQSYLRTGQSLVFARSGEQQNGKIALPARQQRVISSQCHRPDGHGFPEELFGFLEAPDIAQKDCEIVRRYVRMLAAERLLLDCNRLAIKRLYLRYAV